MDINPDSGLVTAMLAVGPTCLPCVAKECGLSLTAAETVLAVVERAIEVQRRENSTCEICRRVTLVFSILPGIV